MPILIPIDDEAAGTAPVMSAAGAAQASATLSVSNFIRGVAAGTSAAAAQLGLGPGGALSLSGAGAGSSSAAARLRLNDEANVDFAGETFGAAQASGTLSLTAGLAGRSDGRGAAAATLAVARGDEFGFAVFLDIAGAAFGAGRMRRYVARLTSMGATLPARRIVERAAPGALGVTLEVDLAKPDRAIVAAASNLDFEVGVWSGGAFAYETLLTGGVRASDTATYANERQRPADRVSFGALDSLGDRWRLAPAAPLTLYDPDRTAAPAKPSTSNLTLSPGGVKLEPVSTPVFGLSLRAVLDAAYVEGCGFERVVTNIPDFPVAEVTFGPEGGYHEAVKPLLGLFEPVYFADGQDLWIVDADQPLPAGLTPLALTAADAQTIADEGPPRALVSALILEYKDTARGDYFTERIEQDEPEETGRFGEQGYTSTVTERRIREYRNLAAPEVIVGEETVYTKKTTTASDFAVAGRETQYDQFDALGRKAGHRRTVEARVPDLSAGGALALLTVTEETYSVFYRGGRSPAADEIARTVTEVAGLVLVDADKPYLGKPYEIPFTDAHLSGYVDPEANQTAEFKAIRTVTETYERQGAETQVYRRPVNHLNGGTVENPSSQTRAGTTAVARRAQGTRRMVVTLDGAPVAGRVMPTFSAGDIPPEIALVLARRKLRRLNDPPRPVTINLPYLDFRARRGSVVAVYARGGAYLGVFMVEGYTRTYEQVDSGEQKFSTVLNTRQLTGDAGGWEAFTI
jgi:hypothetical protein